MTQLNPWATPYKVVKPTATATATVCETLEHDEFIRSILKVLPLDLY
jgi:hypothetical protein